MSSLHITFNMTDRERINRSRESIHYSDLSDEEAFNYQVSGFFSKQSSQFFKKSIFSTRLDRMKKMLSTQSQIIQGKFYELKVSDFFDFLLEHDIFDFETKNRKKDVRDSQKNELLNFHTSIRESDSQITSSVIRVQRQFRHRHFHRRFIIESESVNQEIIIVKEKTIDLYFRLIDKNAKSSISFMIKSIDEFKKSVIERSANWMQSIFMLFEEMDVIKKLKQKIQQEQTKTVIQLEKQKRQNVVQTQKFSDLQSRLIDIENQLLFDRTAVNDLTHQKIEIARMKRCKDQHRTRENELAEKIKTLKMNKVAFEKKILEFTNRQSRQANFIDDFDQEDFRTEIRRQNFDRSIEVIELLFRDFLRRLVILFQKRIFERVHESESIEEQSLMTRTIHEHKIKYQNISNFYEDHDEWKK